jgi:DNA-binding CsgD family transcriptional regulator
MITTKKDLDSTDKKILKGFSEGMTAKEIAQGIGISPHTISVRVREMKKYYVCKNIAQLVLKCQGEL